MSSRERKDIQTRLANAWNTCAEAIADIDRKQAEIDKLHTLLSSARKRVSWLVLNTPTTAPGWHECSALVDEIDEAQTITSTEYERTK